MWLIFDPFKWLWWFGFLGFFLFYWTMCCKNQNRTETKASISIFNTFQHTLYSFDQVLGLIRLCVPHKYNAPVGNIFEWLITSVLLHCGDSQLEIIKKLDQV
jgi:hypothetical protein